MPDIVSLLKDGGLYNAKLDYSEMSHPTIVAEYDGVVIGFVQGLIGRPYTVVTEIAISPSARGLGVGRGLMAELERCAKDSGSSAIFAATSVDNDDVNAKITHSWGTYIGDGRLYVRYC